MKIVDVCGFYSPRGGGIRTYVSQKLRQADAFGHDITILAPGETNGVHELTQSSRIETIAAPPFILDRNYHGFMDQDAVHSALDRISPDMVEASSPWNSAEFVASYPRPVPRALVMHSDPLSAHAYRWFEAIARPNTVDKAFDWFWKRLRRYGQRFDAIIAANSSLAGRLSNGGVANVYTVPMGVEPGVFSPRFRSNELRRRLLGMCALNEDATLLVCAGRLANEKRVPMLVDAVTKAGQCRPLGMVIFGEGRARNKILRRVAGNPHIRLLRPVRSRTGFASLLASADALIHGCEAETFGMAVAEAQASGIPIVAPNAGGTSDFLASDPTLGFQVNEIDDIVRAILSVPRPGTHYSRPVWVRSMVDHFDELFEIYGGLTTLTPGAADPSLCANGH